MKYYSQLIYCGKPCFDVVWGEPLKEDNTLVVYKRNNLWNILDIASGLKLCGRTMKSKKAVLAWYDEQKQTNSLYEGLEAMRKTDTFKASMEAMQQHRSLHPGDRVTYIDVKDSVILDLIKYYPRADIWLVQDEWHKFEVSTDRIIKLSEVK